MEKKEMKHLKKLIAEKKDLESRLEKQQFKPKEELADTVKDYRTGYPKTIVIRGYGDKEWQRLRDVYYMKLGDICGRIQRMEDFLNSVEDAELREILRLRYQDGLSQEEIAERLNYSRSAIQKKEERFWKSV
jgi:DNA-binding MarR family transcriptional regulator